ncbi:MAG TPA: sigma-70 family RNA polymerase sigma factor [Acidimicrobiales bacterium]|nr:sigma-70 family RNA polymerase sigma factor [Acidimicrobiales bacterium]
MDLALILRVRDGDPTAMAQLWRRHFPSACGAARRIAGCSDPTDAASEAFLATVRAIRSGHGPVTGSFRAYVCSVAARFAVREAVRRSVLEEWDGHQSYAATAEEAPLATSEADADVIGWDQLPERWRHVLWLTVVERRTPADVAKMVGLTPNAVAALAYRARCRLRDLQPSGDVLEMPDEPAPQSLDHNPGPGSNVNDRGRNGQVVSPDPLGSGRHR